MAHSGLEQRCVPLLLSCPVWSPWGPGLTAPYEDYAEDGIADGCDHVGTPSKQLQRRPRSHSWGNYSPHSLTTRCSSQSFSDSFSKQCSLSEQETTDSLSDSQDTTDHEMQITYDQESPMLLGNVQNDAARQCPMLLDAMKGRGGEEKSNAICASSNANDEVTTMMIRNLPFSLTQQRLVATLDSTGFKGLYDFAYMPHKFKEHRNLGFAFVNFVSPSIAQAFLNEWHLSKILSMPEVRGRPLNVSPAVVQGREANIHKASSRKMSRVKNAGFKPLLLEESSSFVIR